MSQHTPGPWLNSKGFQSQIYDEATGHTLAIVGQWGVSEEANNANARLIAAAPDLLELARRLVVWMCHAKTGGVLNFEDVERQARAAIAKAEGRDG